MVLWKTWFDLRTRFFICLGLLILNVLSLIVFFPLFGTFLTRLKMEIPLEQWKQIQAYASDYLLYMDAGWFHKDETMAAFAVIFALGGIMTEAKTHTVLLSLSLPVLRRRWVLSHAVFAWMYIMILAAVASILIVLAGFVYGKSYPLTRALMQTFLMPLIAFPWIGATLAVTSLTFDKLRAGLIVFGAWFLTGLLEKIPPVRIWLPGNLMDLAEPGSFPWQSLIVILVVGIGGIFFAVNKFEESDF
ncbi:hypothetical protein L0222_25580 [bacterium]|nr:hypothetical protein [bacterium]MCI0606920.1 hypothetical protein [bacterium]